MIALIIHALLHDCSDSTYRQLYIYKEIWPSLNIRNEHYQVLIVL